MDTETQTVFTCSATLTVKIPPAANATVETTCISESNVVPRNKLN